MAQKKLNAAQKVLNRVSVIYDRRKTAEKTGKGKVEIRIRDINDRRKYISVRTCTPIEWQKFQNDRALAREVEKYVVILEYLVAKGKALTVENIERELCLPTTRKVNGKPKIDENGFAEGNFIEFFKQEMSKEKYSKGTEAKRTTTLNGLLEYKKLKKFSDITPANIRAFDRYLRKPVQIIKKDENGNPLPPEEYTRSDAGVHNYHKTLRVFIKKAVEQELIPKDPYDIVKFPKGHAKERYPLVESELIQLRNLELQEKRLDKARDIFIFCAYTGLAYVDAMNFNYNTMVDHVNGYQFIDGERVKTGSTFYTPILAPALNVLKKYDYSLPHISCQKLNDYLHEIEGMLQLRKPMTSHVARHSFATLNIMKDTPLTRLQKMMGHKHQKTTEIYAHLSSILVTEQVASLASSIL